MSRPRLSSFAPPAANWPGWPTGRDGCSSISLKKPEALMTLLNTTTATFLNGLRDAGGKPLHEQTVDEVRAGIRMVSQQLSAPPADVHAVTDRSIPVRGAEIAVRVYTPRPAGDP